MRAAAEPGLRPGGGLAEAEALPWRRAASERGLRRDGWLWTAWTSWVVGIFAAPGAVLIWIEPFAFPAAAACFAHAWAVPWLQARRGARSLVPIGADPRADNDAGAEGVALGLLGDLVDHEQRDLLSTTGVVVERGRLGVWLLGKQGAILVRSGGRRVDCWCVRVAEREDLPGGDQVAHLLLAVREDERGFAKVANFGFSGATWRVRRHLAPPARPAFNAGRALARRR